MFIIPELSGLAFPRSLFRLVYRLSTDPHSQPSAVHEGQVPRSSRRSIECAGHFFLLLMSNSQLTHLFTLCAHSPAIDSSNPTGAQPTSVTGAIALSDVHLTYPSRPDVPVLKGISLAFAPGKTSALVGASGCGKSSIISLLERFYDPSSGSVTLDGADVRELNLKWLRSQIGLVGQEPVLFSTTVRQNVEYGLAGSTKYAGVGAEERARLVESALKLANAWEFVTGLPEGELIPLSLSKRSD